MSRKQGLLTRTHWLSLNLVCRVSLEKEVQILGKHNFSNMSESAALAGGWCKVDEFVGSTVTLRFFTFRFCAPHSSKSHPIVKAMNGVTFRSTWNCTAWWICVRVSSHLQKGNLVWTLQSFITHCWQAPPTVLEVVETGKVRLGTGSVKRGLSCFDIWTECQSCPAGQVKFFLFYRSRQEKMAMGPMPRPFQMCAGVRNAEIHKTLATRTLRSLSGVMTLLLKVSTCGRS